MTARMWLETAGPGRQVDSTQSGDRPKLSSETVLFLAHRHSAEDSRRTAPGHHRGERGSLSMGQLQCDDWEDDEAPG